MAIRIRKNKLNILWPINILKYCLPFVSFTFFGQSFLLLLTIFDCKDGFSYVSTTLKCRTGIWFSIYGVLAGIALFVQSSIAIITTSLYFKPIFINVGSDLLKKTNSFPDNVFTITKILINVLFISDKGSENEHWNILLILIILTGINAYYTLYYQNRANKSLTLLNNIFSVIALLAYLSLLIGKVFKTVDFTGSIYLYFSSILITIIFIFTYKDNELDYILIDYRAIDNSVDFLYYVSTYYRMIQRRNKSRDYLAILKTLITNYEQNCVLIDCPLKKYTENMKKGIEYPFLLNQYCQKLFEYGIAKFSGDNSLKYNYSIFLVTAMNYKKKALMILNTIKEKALSFQNKFDVHRAFRLIDKWKFSHIHKNSSTFIYRKNIQEFKAIIRKLILLYYDFMSLLLNTKFENNDNFNKIHKIGSEIMKYNPIIEDLYTRLISFKTDNYEIIKLYTDFVEKILKNEEKLEKSKKNAKLTFSNKMDIYEKDYANFDLEVLNDNGHIPYLIISAHKDRLGKIIDLSTKATKIFGYTKYELINQHINILIPKILQQNHDIMISKQNEKHKLKFFDDLNKNKIYFPGFINKDAFGITKMKFLIELTLNIYFIKTGNNSLVYIVEIINYNPLMLDLMKPFNNSTKCCVLTDENFLIQNFSANSLEHLKLNYSVIHSNYSIINYIKQFQEDYLNEINNTGNNMYSQFFDEKLSEKKFNKISIPASIRKRIKYDLLIKKYSNRCRITWKTSEETNSNEAKSQKKILISKKSQNNIRYTESNILRPNKTANPEETEIDMFMEIKNIIINDELLGYLFYFTKVKSKNYNNMSYIIHKNDTVGIKNDITILKLKKYQCEFRTKNSSNEETRFKSGKNQLFSSFIEKSEKIEKSCMRKKQKRKSLEKYSDNKKKLSNNHSFIGKKGNLKSSFAKFDNDIETIITGEFIPEFSCHFSLNISNLTFDKLLEKEKKINYLSQLKKEAYEKYNSHKQLLNFVSRYSNTSSNESEESENIENSSYDKISSNSYIKDSSNTNSNSLNENNKKEQSIKIRDSIKNNNDLKTPLPIIKNSLRRDNYQGYTNISSVNMSNSSLPKREKRNYNYYRVNLNNIIFMIYDFNKDIIIEDTKTKNVSKIDTIMADTKNQESIEMEKEERFSYFYTQNNNKNKKYKKNKIEDKDKKAKNEDKNANIKRKSIKINKLDEEKLIEKKIYESLNKHKSEPSIIKLKLISYFATFLIILYGIITIYLDSYYLNNLKINLNKLKYYMFLSYYSPISVYYIRELILLNYNVAEIEGGEYVEIPALNKSEYKNLIKEKLFDLFIDNQNSMRYFYSNALHLNPKASKILANSQETIKMSSFKKINMKYDILTALMQYVSAFYNLASSPNPIEQNHSDAYSYIYNNMNGYKKAINRIINAFSTQLTIYSSEIKNIMIFYSTFIFISFSILYIFIIIYIIVSFQTRGNYIRVFYGINESIIKKTIFNCQSLLYKLKTFEAQNYYDDENSFEGKLTFCKTKSVVKKEISLSDNYNLNENNEIKKRKTLSSLGIIFIIFYGIFFLMCFFYYEINGYRMIIESNDSIIKYNICQRILDIQITLIDSFNIYRELLYDNECIIDGLNPEDYLDKKEKEEYPKISEKILYIKLFEKKISKNISNISKEKGLCNYYINDLFDSYVICEETIGLITKYDFNVLTKYFLEEITIKRNIIKYKLTHEKILGNLTQYNYTEYINNKEIPRKGELNYSNIFRLDLFNDGTLHKELNIIFFSIILPYIQKNKEKYFDILSFENKKYNIIPINYFILFIIILVFFCYIIPVINYINKLIYKTKNMLSVIPLSVLSFQSDALLLLNISNNK